MDKNIIKAALITIIVQIGLYQIDGRSSWNNTWFILGVFVVSWVILVALGKKKRLSQMPNVIDLDQYRRKKKKKHTQKQQETLENKKVVIYTTCEKTKIELIKSLLNSNQIDCFLNNRHAASILPSIEGIDLELQVRYRDLERAMQILKDHKLLPIKQN